MYDVKTLKATPGLARRLLHFSQMNHMVFGEDLIELAMSGLVDPKDLEGFAYPMNAAEISTLQHVEDWDGRAMILADGPDRGRKIALASAFLKPGSKSLILTQPKCYPVWANLILEVWPDAKISVFGNPRYQEKNNPLPDGVEFKESYDADADFFISSYSGVIWQNFVAQKIHDQTFVEEFENQGTVSYKWEAAVKGIFREMPKPLFLQNINTLPSDNGRSNFSSLQLVSSRAMSYLSDLVSDYMWAGLQTARPLMTQYTFKEAEEYLTRHNYHGLDSFKIMSLFGVSSHLLEESDGTKKPLVFRDGTVHQLKSSGKRKDSGLYRMVEREQGLKESTGLSITELVRDILDGKRPSETLSGPLMGTQWANLKSSLVKNTHEHLTARSTRSLILADHPDLRRALRLQFGATLEDLRQVDDYDYVVSRFLHPMLTGKVSLKKWDAMKPLQSLIVNLDDLINEPYLLQAANYLFMPELPMDRDFYEGVRAAADAQGTRLVHNVLDDTFEAKIFKEIAEN